MTPKNTPIKKKKFPILLVVGVVLVAGVLLTVGGLSFAAYQESHDPFCGSCHSQPETTFLQRSTTQAVDLASYHTTQQTLCINCHSGPGTSGRLQAELMGARNAMLWFSGTAVQPAVLNYPISDQNCLKCHQNVIQKGFTAKEKITIPGGSSSGRQRFGRANHWHEFLTRWQTADPKAGTCVGCHSGHATTVNVKNGFLNDQTVLAACDACHRAIRKGDD